MRKRVILITIFALIVIVGGVGIGLAWRTNRLDKRLPPSIKEMFGRGEGPEEPEEEPESKPEKELGLFSKLSFIYKDGYSIWTADENGANARKVYKHSSMILSFSISPNGKLVAFTAFEDELWLMNTDLIGRRKVDLGGLMPDGAAPSWSPSSQELLLAMSKEGIEDHRDVYKIDVASGAITNLSETTDYEESSPSWSPDGSRISFCSRRGDWAVYLMNPDGSEQKELIEGFDSAWSPDGSKLAINHESTVKIIDVSSQATIRTVRSNGEVYLWGVPCDLFWGSNGKIYLSGGFHLQPEIVVIDSSSGSLGKVKGIAGWNPIYIDVP